MASRSPAALERPAPWDPASRAASAGPRAGSPP